MTRLALLCAVALLCTGCVLADSDTLKELAKSDRSWCFYSGGGMGVSPIRIGGSGVQGGSMKCTGDSFEVNTSGTGSGSNGVVVLPPATPPLILRQSAPTYQQVDPATLRPSPGPVLLPAVPSILPAPRRSNP